MGDLMFWLSKGSADDMPPICIRDAHSCNQIGRGAKCRSLYRWKALLRLSYRTFCDRYQIFQKSCSWGCDFMQYSKMGLGCSWQFVNELRNIAVTVPRAQLHIFSVAFRLEDQCLRRWKIVILSVVNTIHRRADWLTNELITYRPLRCRSGR